MVTGTLISRALLYNSGDIPNGGADSVDPGVGGGRVCGSLLGGKVNREEDGGENWTVVEDMLLRA